MREGVPANYLKIEEHESQFLCNFPCDLVFSFRMEEGEGWYELSLNNLGWKNIVKLWSHPLPSCCNALCSCNHKGLSSSSSWLSWSYSWHLMGCFLSLYPHSHLCQIWIARDRNPKHVLLHGGLSSSARKERDRIISACDTSYCIVSSTGKMESIFPLHIYRYRCIHTKWIVLCMPR